MDTPGPPADPPPRPDTPGTPSQPPAPAAWSAPTAEACYRHPGVVTAVHCTRCGRPICPACMIPAPVGHQCPECVADARREFQTGSATRRARSLKGASATKSILATLIAIFILEVAKGGPNSLMAGPPLRTLVDMGALYPPAVAAGQYWRLISDMFLHAGLLHIALNGYALYLFGSMVEETFGRGKFLVIYFVTGFLGSVASYAFGPVAQVGVGASGAIVGLFGAFIAYNLRRRHTALAMARLRWAAMIILINALLGFGFAAIDWRAHLGGLVAGIGAGFLAEGIGPRRYRTAVTFAGFGAMVLLGVVLVAMRGPAVQAFCARIGGC